MPGRATSELIACRVFSCIKILHGACDVPVADSRSETTYASLAAGKFNATAVALSSGKAAGRAAAEQSPFAPPSHLQKLPRFSEQPPALVSLSLSLPVSLSLPSPHGLHRAIQNTRWPPGPPRFPHTSSQPSPPIGAAKVPARVESRRSWLAARSLRQRLATVLRVMMIRPGCLLCANREPSPVPSLSAASARHAAAAQQRWAAARRGYCGGGSNEQAGQPQQLPAETPRTAAHACRQSQPVPACQFPGALDMARR